MLMEKAVDRNWSRSTAPCYVEVHHVIPKCLGGTINKVDCLKAFCDAIGCTVYKMRNNKVDGYEFRGEAV